MVVRSLAGPEAGGPGCRAAGETEMGEGQDRSGGGPQLRADCREASKVLAWGKHLRGCQKQ